ncbi:hypothetical protein [Actinacidiphila acidipaludis]|uniref:Uncharacterized protein n=1 Tax=Actinacidiphila acidipaludis TaxID=2873382 RepID=A0ABS7QHF3_9ACTN|nr:hypothetical protein [Streptomyces acidipaludis]MBY8882609.1 hypothetical protein [Streptomyces acidipaludis]
MSVVVHPLAIQALQAPDLGSEVHTGIDLQTVPTWLLWISATVGLGAFVAALFRMMPPALRRRGPGVSVWTAAALFMAASALSRNPRGALWFGAIGFLMTSLPLLWMGRLPADMPSAKDPRARQHPQYGEVARRGRIAGLAILVLVVAETALSVAFVRGL